VLVAPGNHDLDRTQNDTFDQGEAVAAGSQFFDPTKAGQSKRQILAPRFKAFRQRGTADGANDWILDPVGGFAEVIEVRGRRVGIAGINTAWLSKDDHDKERLTPGVPLVEAALDRIKGADARFVLGHHPLTWLVEEHAERLRGLFGSREVIYLHGHLHKTEGRREEGAGNTFLVLQSGAAFQARDDEPWQNGLLWGEIDLVAGEVLVSPR